jgi:hypothetical protein
VKGFFAVLAAGFCLAGCGHSSEQVIGAASGQSPADSDAAVQKAVETLGPYAQQTQQDSHNGRVTATYGLKGLTTEAAVNEIEPALIKAGFKEHGSLSSGFVYFLGPTKGFEVSIINPDPIHEPQFFQLTTSRLAEFAGKGSG